MNVAQSSDRYAVLGNPVAHSKSPIIHEMFAAQTGERLSYDALLVPLGSFESLLRQFQERGGRGVNVTLPFKGEAAKLATTKSARAQRAGAVNTIRFEADASMYADNTDGVGLVRDLSVNLGCVLTDAEILILGAGGAVRGILEPLLETRPARICIANRTVAKAEELAEGFGALGEIHPCGIAATSGSSYDLIINATSAGLDGVTVPISGDTLRPHTWCYDLVYANRPTPFVRWAQTHGVAHAVDGLGMLVEQAAEAFFLWRGVRPDTQQVIESLRGVA